MRKTRKKKFLPTKITCFPQSNNLRGQWSKIAPPHSYIDVNDFAGPKELAEYLNYLDGDKEEFLSYFWWKSYYRASFGPEV